jgi:hypothetical protein
LGFDVSLLEICVRKWRDESRRLGAFYLLIELKRADFLPGIASHTLGVERRESLWKEAIKSYNTVVLALATGSIPATERTNVNRRLDTLRTRLQCVGIVIERNDGGELKAV